MRKALVALMLVLLAAGCAEKKVATVPDAGAPGKAAPAAPAAPAKPAEVVAEKGSGAGGEGISSREQQVTGAGEAEMAEGIKVPGVDDIRFDYDKYYLRSDQEATLKRLADWLIKNKGRVVVEGHCDDRGTNEYNIALGDRRAQAVKSFMVSSGVPSSSIETVSYGEERPLCTEQAEACWSKNRRAHFVINK